MKRIANRAERRSGIILMVVLALLTLLALVGITFVLAADARLPGNRAFRQAVETLASDMRVLGDDLARDLRALNDGEDVDLGVYPAALRSLSARAAELRVQVERAIEQSTDAASRAHLRILASRLEGYESLLCGLREIVELIIRGF